MLLSLKNLSKYKIEATDGSIGHVHSFLFDDQRWIIRYLVVDTGHWLPGRRVLITPLSLGKPEGQMEVFPVKLTREQVKTSPDIDTDKPVSRQQEIELFSHYNWAPYWGGVYGPIPEYETHSNSKERTQEKEQSSRGTGTEEESNPHLRSTKEIIGYIIHAKDGELGHVDDFIIHEEDWLLRYLVVDTRKLLPGKKVIVPPDWITNINWPASEVVLDVTKQAVKNSPEFDPSTPVNREYETRLYDYYGRPKYWL